MHCLTLMTWFKVAFCAGVVEKLLNAGDAKRWLAGNAAGRSNGRRRGVERKLRKNAVAMVVLAARDNLTALLLRLAIAR
jgi:hypothetical protein